MEESEKVRNSRVESFENQQTGQCLRCMQRVEAIGADGVERDSETRRSHR